MPLYYFHLRDGDDIVLDPEGRELSGAAAISNAALLEARALISADALHGRIYLGQHIDVEDGLGAIVHRLDFSDAVEIVPPAADYS